MDEKERKELIERILKEMKLNTTFSPDDTIEDAQKKMSPDTARQFKEDDRYYFFLGAVTMGYTLATINGFSVDLSAEVNSVIQESLKHTFPNLSLTDEEREKFSERASDFTKIMVGVSKEIDTLHKKNLKNVFKDESLSESIEAKIKELSKKGIPEETILTLISEVTSADLGMKVLVKKNKETGKYEITLLEDDPSFMGNISDSKLLH